MVLELVSVSFLKCNYAQSEINTYCVFYLYLERKMDAQYIMKSVVITLNFTISIATSLMTALCIYVLSEYIKSDSCGEAIIFCFFNGIFLPLCVIFHVLSSFWPCCDVKDLFGANGVILSIVTSPIYLINIIIGIYFHHADSEIVECIHDEYNKNYILFITVEIIIYYSVAMLSIIFIMFMCKLLVNKYFEPRYRNSPYFSAHLALLGRNNNNNNNSLLETPDDIEEISI